MPKKNLKPPKNIVQEWPEIFEDIYMSAMPIAYIHGVEIEFMDGRIWEIDVHEQLPYNHEDEIIERLMSALKEMSEEIVSINFSVNIDKLKSDVISSTKNVMRDDEE